MKYYELRRSGAAIDADADYSHVRRALAGWIAAARAAGKAAIKIDEDTWEVWRRYDRRRGRREYTSPLYTLEIVPVDYPPFRPR